MGFRKRVIFLFLAIAVVPFVLLQISTQLIYVPTITNRITALITYNLQQKSENLQTILRERTDLFSQVTSDGTFAQIVREIDKSKGPTEYQKSQILEVLSKSTIVGDRSNLMAGISWIGNNGEVVLYNRFGVLPGLDSFSAYGSVQDVIAQVNHKGSLVAYPTRTFRDGTDHRLNVILMVFPNFDLTTNTREGCLGFFLDEAALRAVLNPAVTDQSGISAKTYVFDSAGYLISFPEQLEFSVPVSALVGTGAQPQKLGALIPELKGKNVGRISLPVPKTDWTVCTLYDENTLFSDRNAIILYTFLMGLVFFVTASLAYAVFSRRVLRSFSTLMDRVKIQDNLLNIRNQSQDEFEYLGNVFGRLQDHIVGLVNEVNERNASMVALAQEQRLSEIRALEAQVNPHFLYNTLNTLNWIAIRNGQTELIKGLSDLADIMRYSISQIDVTATLGDELLWLRKYLDLQRLRFKNHFEYEITNTDVDPGFRLYKLLFQPLVENALVHGLDPNVTGGLLEVQFQCLEKGIRATIRDNGRGFQASGTSDKESSFIGLENLKRRLGVYYGGRSSLSWESTPGGGATFILEIPEVES